MAKTFVDGREVKKWFVDGMEVKKAYFNNQLVFSSGFELVISASNHNVQSIGLTEVTLEVPPYDNLKET